MNHRDAAPLAVGGIVPASFLSCRACVIPPKKHIPTIASSSLSAYESTLLVAFSLGFVRFGPPPPSWPPCPHSKVDTPQVAVLLQHQALIIQQLIVMLGPNFRGFSSLVTCPNFRVFAALRDCIGIGLQDII